MSVTLQRYNFTLQANGVAIIHCMGTRVRVLSSTGAVTIDLDIGGKLTGLLAGQGYKGAPFTTLTLTDASGALNSGEILVSDDDFIDDRLSIAGSVAVAPSAVAMTNVQATVTNASAQLKAALAARRYLLIQNNGLGDIYVRTDGAAATLATGLKVAAGGGVLEFNSTCPSGAITAIGSIANNPDVVVVEG